MIQTNQNSRSNIYHSGTSTIKGPSQRDSQKQGLQSSSRVKVDLSQRDDDAYGSAGVMEDHEMTHHKPKLNGDIDDRDEAVISPQLDPPMQEMK